MACLKVYRTMLSHYWQYHGLFNILYCIIIDNFIKWKHWSVVTTDLPVQVKAWWYRKKVKTAKHACNQTIKSLNVQSCLVVRYKLQTLCPSQKISARCPPCCCEVRLDVRYFCFSIAGLLEAYSASIMTRQ